MNIFTIFEDQITIIYQDLLNLGVNEDEDIHHHLLLLTT